MPRVIIKFVLAVDEGVGMRPGEEKPGRDGMPRIGRCADEPPPL